MGIIEVLVRQSGKPSGILGRTMVKIMNHVDLQSIGFNNILIENKDAIQCITCEK
jgi:hypothetical protein